MIEIAKVDQNQRKKKKRKQTRKNQTKVSIKKTQRKGTIQKIKKSPKNPKNQTNIHALPLGFLPKVQVVLVLKGEKVKIKSTQKKKVHIKVKKRMIKNQKVNKPVNILRYITNITILYHQIKFDLIIVQYAN